MRRWTIAIEEYLFPLLAILVLGVAKGGFGGVGAPVVLPIMSMGLPVETALGVLLPILLTMDIVNVVSHRKYADYKAVSFALPGALVGVGIGAVLIDIVPGPMIGGAVGVIAILFAMQSLMGIGVMKKAISRVYGLGFGMASGLTSTVAHAGGPPIHMYFLSRGYEQRKFVATSNVFLASVNVLKIGPFIAVGALGQDAFELSIILVPIAAIAAGIGVLVAKFLPKSAFKLVVNILMIVAGAKLIFNAF